MITFNWGKQSLSKNINNINVQEHYRIITEKFCELYYKTYDTNYHDLKGLYSNSSSITYLNKEYIGFNDVLYYLLLDQVKSFTHNYVHVNSQPLSDSSILITATGNLTINNQWKKQFTDTFVIQSHNDTFYITNHIFKN